MTVDRKAEYLAKLRDPRWQKMRLEVLQRDAFTCRQCFDDKSTLHVHHRWYLSGADPWEYPLAALVTLCESCHEQETIMLRGYTDDFVLMLKQCGALSSQFFELCNAVVPSTDAPMHEYDWSVVAFVLGRLMRSRLDNGDDWRRAAADFQKLGADKAEG